MECAQQAIGFEAESGVQLSGVLHRPARLSETGVVVLHGMLSTKNSPKHTGIAAGLCARGHLALRFDFEGRGESGGDLMELSFTREVAQCRAAMTRLRLFGCTRLGLVGSSMGGAVAILTAAEGEVAALATMAAVGRTDLLPVRAVGEKGLDVWKRKGRLRLGETQEKVGYVLVEDAMRVDVPAAAAKIACPWLILHGERDEVIPASDAETLAASSGRRAELEIVPGADHRFSRDGHRDHVTRRIVEFLDGVLSG